MSMRSVSMILFVAAFAGGCTETSPTSPVPGDVTALSGLGGPEADGSITTATLNDIPAAAPDGIGGNADIATLTRTAHAVEFTLDATDLVPGHAYSIWWAVFEKAQFCVDGCNGPDIGNPLVQGSFFNGGGGVADGSGNATFSNRVVRHDLGDRFIAFGEGIDNTLKAEIHLIFRSHGIAETDPADLALQTTTPFAFCNLPHGPAQGPPGCKDVGVIVFPRP